MRRWSQLVITVAVVVFLLVPAATSGTATEETTPIIEEHTTIDRTPEKPGEVTATVEFSLPRDVTKFSIANPPEDVTVESTRNFRKTEGGYEWTGSGTPELTYTLSLPVDSVDDDGDGIDTGEWAVVSPNSFRAQWTYTGTAPEYTTTVTIDGEGVKGDEYLLLGDHSTATKMIDEREVTIAGPAASLSSVDTAGVFQTLDFTSEHLWMRSDQDSTLAIVIPGKYRSSTHSGRTIGSSFYVISDEQEGLSRTWEHEYIHTGQQARMGDNMAWFTEASANYYSARLRLNQGGMTYGEFERTVTTGKYSEAVLTDRSTWESSRVEYEKGEHVLAGLDGQIQAETDGEKTLKDVYQAVQAHDGKVTYDEFIVILRDVAGPETVKWADGFIDGTGLPPVNQSQSMYLISDVDSDRDGLTNAEEGSYGTDALVADSDSDGLRDGVEVERKLDPLNSDTDQDGVSDGEELNQGLLPTHIDSDGDYVSDGVEGFLSFDPRTFNTPEEVLSAVKKKAGND